MRKSNQQRSRFGRINIIFWSCLLGMYIKDIAKHANMLLIITESCQNPKFPISTWSYDMEGHVKKCVERYCELTNKTTEQLCKVSAPCIDDRKFSKEELRSVEELSDVCSQRRMFTNCFEMSIFDTTWWISDPMISEQTCTCGTKCTANKKLSCGNTTMSIGRVLKILNPL